MRFALTDEQAQIRASADALLADRMPLAAIQRRLEGETEQTDALWQALAELGWHGIHAGEDHGGLGLGVVELAILVESLGYALAPIPFLSNAAAALLIDRLGSEQQRERWLAPIVAGTLRATVGLLDGPGATVFAGDEITGAQLAVPDAKEAAIVVVAVDAGFAVVELGAAGVTIGPAGGLDLTRPVCTVDFDHAAGHRLDRPGGAPDRARACIDALVAAECTGVARRALDASVAYAKQRKQFGTPIGAFQAVSHRCADMLRDVEGSRSVAYGAAWACDADDDEHAARAANIAKAHAVPAAIRVCESAIQVHGGIGFTWESHLHLLLRRSQADVHIWGATSAARAAIAAGMGI